jgi:hypothetical protein
MNNPDTKKYWKMATRNWQNVIKRSLFSIPGEIFGSVYETWLTMKNRHPTETQIHQAMNSTIRVTRATNTPADLLGSLYNQRIVRRNLFITAAHATKTAYRLTVQSCKIK